MRGVGRPTRTEPHGKLRGGGGWGVGCVLKPRPKSESDLGGFFDPPSHFHGRGVTFTVVAEGACPHRPPLSAKPPLFGGRGACLPAPSVVGGQEPHGKLATRFGQGVGAVLKPRPKTESDLGGFCDSPLARASLRGRDGAEPRALSRRTRAGSPASVATARGHRHRVDAARVVRSPRCLALGSGASASRSCHGAGTGVRLTGEWRAPWACARERGSP